MTVRLGATLLWIAVLLAGCSSAGPGLPTAAPDLGHGLAKKVTADAMMAHLRALQNIANANGGNRADGTPGFQASVDYVAKALRDKGFDVQTPQFDRLYPVSPGKPTLTVPQQNSKYGAEKFTLPPLAGPPRDARKSMPRQTIADGTYCITAT